MDLDLTELRDLSPCKIFVEHVFKECVPRSKTMGVNEFGWVGEAGKEDMLNF
jgi:hypothetical protein